MRCPWCGSGPVTIRGDRWECGWCGDCGRLKRPATVTFRVSFVYRVDLFETWDKLKTALAAAVPGRDAGLRPLLGRVLLYAVSAGVRRRGTAIAAQKWQELETFLKETRDLCADLPAAGTLRAVRAGVLYEREAELSEAVCGTFWAELISALTPEQYYGGESEGISDLLHELSAAYAYFGGEEGEEMGLAQERGNAWEAAFYRRWRESVLLHPDAARANPHLGSETRGRGLKLALNPEERRPKPRRRPTPGEEPPDDGTVFRYCTVRFQGAPRPYAYLTGGLPVKVGDWVEAPFGRDDLPRRGQVIAVADCTRPAAPWPPERTKTVLRLADPLPAREEAEPGPQPASAPGPEPVPAGGADGEI